MPVRTIRSLIDTHGIEPPDLLSIDVEGHEGAVIRGMPLDSWRPRVLVVEATLPWTTTPSQQDWEPILLAQGYVFAAFNGLNRFYVCEDLRDRLDRLATPVNVLDHFVPHEVVMQHERAADLQRRLACEQNRMAVERQQHEEIHRAWEQDQAAWEQDQAAWEQDQAAWERDQAAWKRDQAAWEQERRHGPRASRLAGPPDRLRGRASRVGAPAHGARATQRLSTRPPRGDPTAPSAISAARLSRRDHRRLRLGAETQAPAGLVTAGPNERLNDQKNLSAVDVSTISGTWARRRFGQETDLGGDVLSVRPDSAVREPARETWSNCSWTLISRFST